VSGFLALLDDVAAIAKLAATQIDDIAAHAAKAGGKSAGIVIDDAAVTPKYVTGLPAAREIPIVAKIAAGSLISKLAILLPGLKLSRPGPSHLFSFSVARIFVSRARRKSGTP
jgi:predicted DNA repair protein MutK